eukprot:TRINITY_DN65313_c0_g1_i1.p1 TRINITY_DN65313_c0_g1~~TRINITY_DN65313_c0_g1_i1.p1  ORF type:complete len:304 (+),score=51.55 TRINITY_DN65313_c0_g1_i1:79-990(+)
MTLASERSAGLGSNGKARPRWWDAWPEENHRSDEHGDDDDRLSSGSEGNYKCPWLERPWQEDTQRPRVDSDDPEPPSPGLRPISFETQSKERGEQRSYKDPALLFHAEGIRGAASTSKQRLLRRDMLTSNALPENVVSKFSAQSTGAEWTEFKEKTLRRRHTVVKETSIKNLETKVRFSKLNPWRMLLELAGLWVDAKGDEFVLRLDSTGDSLSLCSKQSDGSVKVDSALIYVERWRDQGYDDRVVWGKQGHWACYELQVVDELTIAWQPLKDHLREICWSRSPSERHVSEPLPPPPAPLDFQ